MPVSVDDNVWQIGIFGNLLNERGFGREGVAHKHSVSQPYSHCIFWDRFQFVWEYTIWMAILVTLGVNASTGKVHANAVREIPGVPSRSVLEDSDLEQKPQRR